MRCGGYRSVNAKLARVLQHAPTPIQPMTPAPEELFEIIQSVDTYLMALAVTPDPRAKRAARTILRVWRSITRPHRCLTSASVALNR
jgi:hypothetical protein